MQKSKYVSWLFLCNSMHQFALLTLGWKRKNRSDKICVLLAALQTFQLFEASQSD